MTMTQIHTNPDDLERSFQIPTFELPPAKSGGPQSRIIATPEETAALAAAEHLLDTLALGARVKANLAQRLARGSVDSRLAAATDIHALVSRKASQGGRQVDDQPNQVFHDSVPAEIQERLTFLATTNYGQRAIEMFRPPLGPFVHRALAGEAFNATALRTLQKAMRLLEVSVEYWQGRMPSVAPAPQPAPVPPVTLEEFQQELHCHGLSERLEDYVLGVFREQGVLPALDTLEQIKQRLRQKAQERERAERLEALIPVAEAAAQRLITVLWEINPAQLEANQGFLDRRAALIEAGEPQELAKWIAKCDHKADTARPPVIIPAGQDDKSFARVMATEPKRPKAPEKSDKSGKRGGKRK